MKRPIEFFASTAWSGLVLVLPVLLLYLLLVEIFELLIALATPIANVLSAEAFAEEQHPVVVAVILLAVSSFLFGLLARSQAGRRVGRWLEQRLLNPLPVYALVKGLTAAVLEVRDSESFRPALLDDGAAGLDPVYVVGAYDDQRAIVLLPGSPTSFAGTLKIVERSRLRMLDIRLGDFSRIISNLGVGMTEARLRRDAGA